ncbi:MAG TPA: 6-carboxytetrahydropterin synthase [Tepidisphaeraceae bacterium]|nr:6-carboxytetrahydropterin synthase [Tepidisphaeraceae bacterium]
MFRLTREVRFAVNSDDPSPAAYNGHAGYPPLTGLGIFASLQVTIAGELNPISSCLLDIKEIDAVVRRDGIAIVKSFLDQDRPNACGLLLQRLFDCFRQTWPGLFKARLNLSPYLAVSVTAGEYPMVRSSQKFEFSAAHRLHNPALSHEQNVALFGKCNNPHGHGHNYEIEVTLRGKPDESGQLLPVQKLEEIVAATVIAKFDHKFLNQEVAELSGLNPTVENIAQVAFHLLKPRIAAARSSSSGVELAAVTVWETPKTWCEYSE